MKSNQNRRKSPVRAVLYALFACAFCIGAYKLTTEQLAVHKENKDFESLAAIVAAAAAAEPTVQPVEQTLDQTRESETEPEQGPGEDTEPKQMIGNPGKNKINAKKPAPEETPAPVVLAKYAPLVEKNPDFFGWLKIDTTQIDYPVMYAPDREQYYLHRDFDGYESFSGCLFVDERCPENGNFYLIYGHNMQNKTMFGHLVAYTDESFWKQHPTFRFDTRYEEREYTVVSAFLSQIYPDNEKNVFRYYEYPDLTNKKTFNEFVKQAKAAALYDTDVTAVYGDELIALTTCYYHVEEGRFVVVAKRVK